MIKTYSFNDGRGHDRYRVLGGYFTNTAVALNAEQMENYPLNTKIIPDERTQIDITFWILPGKEGDKTFNATRYIFGAKNVNTQSGTAGNFYLTKGSAAFTLNVAGTNYSFSDTNITTTGSRFRFSLGDDTVVFSNLTSGFSRGVTIDTLPFSTTPATQPIFLFGMNRGGQIYDGSKTPAGGIVAIEECYISGYDKDNNFLDYHFLPVNDRPTGDRQIGPVFYGLYDVNAIDSADAFHSADTEIASNVRFIPTTGTVRGSLPPFPETENSFKTQRKIRSLSVVGLPEEYTPDSVLVKDVEYTIGSITEMKKGSYQPHIVVEALHVPGYEFDHFEINEVYEEIDKYEDDKRYYNSTLINDYNNPAAVRLRNVEIAGVTLDVDTYVKAIYKPSISGIRDFGKCFIKPGKVSGNDIQLKCELEVLSAEIQEDLLQHTTSTILVKDLPKTVVPGDIILLYSSAKRVYQGIISNIATGDETQTFTNRYLDYSALNISTLECNEMQSIFNIDFLFHNTASIPDTIDSTKNINVSHTIVQKAIDSIYFERLAAGQLSDNWKSGSTLDNRSGAKAYDLDTFNRFRAFKNGYYVKTHSEEFEYYLIISTGEVVEPTPRGELVWTNLYDNDSPGENPLYETGGLLSPANIDKHDTAEVSNFEDMIFKYSDRDMIYMKFDIRPDSSIDGYPYVCYSYRPNLNALHLNSFDEEIQNVEVNEDSSEECSVLVCYNSSGSTIRAVYAKQKVVISEDPLTYSDYNKIFMIMKNGKRLVGTNVPYSYEPSDKYGVKIEVSDDPLKNLKHKNMTETDENNEITFDVMLDSGRYRLEDFVLGRDVNLYFKNKAYRSIITAYKFSIAEDGMIHSLNVTLGKTRSTLSGKLNLGRIRHTTTYATE